MCAITRAVNKTTQAKLTGLCHGVQGTVRYLCNYLEVPYSEVSVLYCGMNHLTFITHFTRQGEDLWPLVNARLEKQPPPGDPFSWEVYRAYGAFPAVLDRHITEFFPERFGSGAYYGKTLGVDIMDIIAGIKSGDERYEHMAAQAEGRVPLEPGLFERTLGEHEALIPILESMFADRQQLFPMNVPNQTVSGIPAGFVLEMPVLATRFGCLPIALPPLPPALLAWITEALYGVEITVEAAITGRRDLFVQALLYDRCVQTLQAAQALADDLLRAHREHLPRFE
jgi:alpha-galactosidase